MTAALPASPKIDHPLGDATRAGSELRWDVVLADGRRGVAARLLPELCRDEAVRRRYVADIERRASLSEPGLAQIVAFERGDTPWRVRTHPSGESLDAWIERRAPAPADEVAELGAQLADILHRLHRRGIVIRDLHPRMVVLTTDGPVFTDVGLSRIDLLSTRTAASLVLENSPYVSPEQLRNTVVDPRSDLFGLGVILWESLTHSLPWADGPALLREPEARPHLRALRPDVPESLAQLVERCLAFDPESRPSSAATVAGVLRGATALAATSATVTCQSCGEALRLGQRLCTACGKQAVSFEHTNDPQAYRLVLTKAKETAEFSVELRRLLASLSDQEVPPLDFIVGDSRMYSKAERARRHKLPLVLFDRLDAPTAHALAKRFADASVPVAARRVGRRETLTTVLRVGVVALFAVGMIFFVAGLPVASWAVLSLAVAVGGVGLVLVRNRRRKRTKKPLLRLRSGPAALPASDPWVARLAAAAGPATAPDVRERIGELALRIQRLVDHRTGLAADGAERRELGFVTEPIGPLVSLIEAEVQRLGRIDHELASLDEGVLVRALARAQAREESDDRRALLLTGLDRLRTLEEQRAAAIGRLLDAGELLRRSTELGLGVRDPQAEHEREVALALASLASPEP